MITFAKINDIDAIMEFIDKEWKTGHILARDRALFEWIYVNNNKVNFVISKNNGSIDGILGYIPFDVEDRQISLAIWKALKSPNEMIGMSMLAFIKKELNPAVIATPGINPTTSAAIYRYLKYEVGKMSHFYRLAKQNDFYIASVRDNRILTVNKNVLALPVTKIKSYEEYELKKIKLADKAIKKDRWYIERRYFNHPVFEYQHYIVEETNGNALDIVAREQKLNNHKCLRVVDLLGNYELLKNFTTVLDNILIENDYEYVDCYVAGLQKNIFLDAGWTDADDTDNIIPNYFYPFERKKIDIYYSCNPHSTVILRGDGDQDRPN